MDELVKLIDVNFEYESHSIEDEMMQIFVRSVRKEGKCPYCGNSSDKVHSMYFRKFRDLPIQEKKVEIVINNRKFKCLNAKCSRKTFAETFDCLPKMERRSKRLTKAIVNTAINLSSIAAEKILRSGTADVGKSTIIRLLKKEHTNQEG